jgi:NADH:ubiquinone oxidoreductase subunit 4 (subunit M)
MKYCIDCGHELANEARRCDSCKTIQPNYHLKRRRIGIPFLVLRWVMLTLLVTGAWAVIGFESHESMLFAIGESAFGSGIIVALDQLLDFGL